MTYEEFTKLYGPIRDQHIHIQPYSKRLRTIIPLLPTPLMEYIVNDYNGRNYCNWTDEYFDMVNQEMAERILLDQ